MNCSKVNNCHHVRNSCVTRVENVARFLALFKQNGRRFETFHLIMFTIIKNSPFNLELYNIKYDLVSYFKRIIFVLCYNFLICERLAFAIILRSFSMETEMPDLSHLTAAERAHINNVLERQRQEEEQERLIVEWVPLLFRFTYSSSTIFTLWYSC